MSVAGIKAVSLVILLKVVVRSDPFHWTVEPETKLDPFTVSVKTGLPATAELGLIPLIAESGLLIVRVSVLLTAARGWAESRTRTVNSKVPADVGVPLKVP